MRPTDPRERLYPVLPLETYRRLGISPPRPPQLYGTGGPVSAAGTPYLTGSAVAAAAAAPPAPGPAATGPAPTTAPAPPLPGWAPVPTPPARKDHTLWIVAGATAMIIVIIAAATWYIVSSRTSDDEQQIRAVIAAETNALNARDLGALIATRCAVDVRQLEGQFTPQTFAAEVDSMVGPEGRWSVAVGVVTVDRSAGTATAEESSTPVGSSASLPQTVTDTVHLRKESGAWKVCVSASPGP